MIVNLQIAGTLIFAIGILCAMAKVMVWALEDNDGDQS